MSSVCLKLRVSVSFRLSNIYKGMIIPKWLSRRNLYYHCLPRNPPECLIEQRTKDRPYAKLHTIRCGCVRSLRDLSSEMVDERGRGSWEKKHSLDDEGLPVPSPSARHITLLRLYLALLLIMCQYHPHIASEHYLATPSRKLFDILCVCPCVSWWPYFTSGRLPASSQRCQKT